MTFDGSSPYDGVNAVAGALVHQLTLDHVREVMDELFRLPKPPEVKIRATDAGKDMLRARFGNERPVVSPVPLTAWGGVPIEHMEEPFAERFHIVVETDEDETYYPLQGDGFKVPKQPKPPPLDLDFGEFLPVDPATFQVRYYQPPPLRIHPAMLCVDMGPCRTYKPRRRRRKRPSKGMRKHIRRVKAAERRGQA